MADNLPILLGPYWMETTAGVSGTAENVKARPSSVRVAGSGSGVIRVMTELTVRRIAEDIVAATGSSSTIEYVDRPVDDPQVRRPDTTLAKTVLGWEPRVAWATGLARTVAWFADTAQQSA